MDATNGRHPEVLGRRPSRTGDRVTKRAQCATLNGLGVGTRESHADAGPRRYALSRRALREFPVLPVLERQLGGRTFSADPALACQRSLKQVYSLILFATRAREIGPASHREAETKSSRKFTCIQISR